MSCYFRHLKDMFQKAGIEVTPSNKRMVDQVVHQIVGVPYKDCPAAWRKLRQRFLKDEEKRREFVRLLKNALPRA